MRLNPVVPAREVTLIILADTLTSEDVTRVRREVSTSLSNAFLSAHKLQIVNVSGTGGDFSTPLANSVQLQALLKLVSAGKSPASTLALLETLGSIPPNLPGNWANTIIAGRLPVVSKDENWVSAWLGEIYRKQRVRLSFWSLDSSAPPWAQSLAAGSMGLVATGGFNALLPLLNDTNSYVEVNWETKLAKGAWPYIAMLKNASGEQVGAISSLATGTGYSLPFQQDLSARSELGNTPPTDESIPQKVLALNPSDLDALRRMAQQLAAQKKNKEAAETLRKVAEITPQEGAVWAEFGKSSYSAEAFDDAGTALSRAAELGVKDASTLEIQARLQMRQNDFAGAISKVEEALVSAPNQQPLWLLRAECARSLKQRSKEAESVERAAALGDVPAFWAKDLIAGYLEAKQPEKAIPYLRKAQSNLPSDAPDLIEYAKFWEQAQQPKEAEALWQKALLADPKSEPAYVGLILNYTAAQRYADAGQVADRGLEIVPKSLPMLSAKEQALEHAGDFYGARRLLTRVVSEGSNLDLLKRRAALEDVYGGAGADSYVALVKALTEQSAPQSEVVAACRRGLLVALREERMDAARIFADKLSSAGDRSGLDLITPRTPPSTQRVEIIGGAEALEFLLMGHTHGKVDPNQSLLEAAGAIANRRQPTVDPNEKEAWQHFANSVHEYFQRVSSLNALGQRKQHAYEIVLTLQDKAGKQRTEKVFDILGLKMHRDKEGVSVKSAEGKSQAKKQDVLAALAIDDQGIEEALTQGKSYTLEIPFDVAPVFPSEEFWRNNFLEKEKHPGGLAEAFVSDIRIPRLYSALNTMDRAAARALVQAVQPKNLLERDSTELWLFAPAFAMNGNSAEVPGGMAARAVWTNLVGADPSSGAAFFEALLHKDEGRMVSFFYTLSQLDVEHQRFFTRSAGRAKSFYQLFHNSIEMRRGGESRLAESGFARFLREVPLNEDLSVDFPGSPEVWMVAKGLKTSGGSVAKMTRKMKQTAAPDDEDQILIRLATTDYKYFGRIQTELANLVVVARIDAQRTEPLTPDSALLLAQSYSNHPGLYPYFARLGDLETPDYQKILTLETKCEGVDSATANMRLGELHSFLSLAGAVHASGLVPAPAFLPLFRKGLDRLIAARDLTSASLAFVADLIPYTKLAKPSGDGAVRQILLGEAGPKREKAFDQVLALQKIPSLDSLLLVERDLQKLNGPATVFDEMQREIERFTVMDFPKTWHLTAERKKSLEFYDTSPAVRVISKMKLTAAKHKKKEDEDLQKLAAELRVDLEPWVELALVGRIYARYLDPSDLLISDDPLLVRKHEFMTLGPHNGKPEFFDQAMLLLSSEAEGSYFTGGLAEFSVAAGEARASGNHLGGNGGESFAKALFASVRATDWRGFTPAVLSAFGSTVRLAREWIVESATVPEMRAELNDAASGVLSLARRKALIQGIEQHEWKAVWEAVSISDLHFLGDVLTEKAAPSLWKVPQLTAMKQAAQHSAEPDMLGSVAPELSGCAQPQMRRYEPYEEYQRHSLPDLLSQRLAELKINLAWVADNAAWEPESVIRLSEPAADALLTNLKMRDSWDWNAAMDAYRNLKKENLEALLSSN